jgi:hypothetical protein
MVAATVAVENDSGDLGVLGLLGISSPTLVAASTFLDLDLASLEEAAAMVLPAVSSTNCA